MSYLSNIMKWNIHPPNTDLYVRFKMSSDQHLWCSLFQPPTKDKKNMKNYNHSAACESTWGQHLVTTKAKGIGLDSVFLFIIKIF